MLNRKSLGILCTLLAMVALFSTCCFAETRGVTKDSVKMGMIMVKTGPVAALGLPYGWGTEDVFREASDKGGINGRKIELFWEDDQFKTPNAIAQFKKLLFTDNVLTIVTCGGTPQTIALMDLIQEYKVPNIPNALTEEMYNPYKPYMFIFGAAYEAQIDIMFDYIMEDLKAQNPKIAVVYAETEFGKKGLEAARKRAQQYGLKLEAEQVLNIGTVDASSQVLALKKAGVDYVVTCNLVPPIITFLRDAEKFDYKPTVFGINWSCDDMVINACKTAANNYYGVSFVGGWEDNSPGMAKIRELAKKYNRDPKKMLTSLYTSGAAVGLLFEEGLKRAGADLTPESLKAALETLNNYDLAGIMPPVTYTTTSHAPQNKCKVYKADVPAGTMKPITDWREPKAMK
jgi:branched-chain amino acid transport system substrate-binding protein